MADIQQMIQMAVANLTNAYAPYSNFSVSCCIQGSNKKHYLGVNVENISRPLGCCAETSAICQMVADGCQLIEHIVVVSGANSLCSPCGGCRQQIHEFANSDTQIYLCDHQSILKQVTIKELLPEAFSY